jgi:hypothetical protein
MSGKILNSAALALALSSTAPPTSMRIPGGSVAAISSIAGLICGGAGKGHVRAKRCDADREALYRIRRKAGEPHGAARELLVHAGWEGKMDGQRRL